MKTASGALTTLLGTRKFISADLFTFTLADGTILRYTTYDKDLTISGNLFSSGGQTGAIFERRQKRATVTWKTGIEVSTLQFDVMPRSELVNGVAFMTACRFGMLDGADVQLERVFMATDSDVSAGTVVLFVGRVAEIDLGRSKVIFNINSHLELLSNNMPRNLYQAACLNTLYDAGCTLVKATFAINSTVQAGSTVSTINTTLAQASGYFDLGQVKFTSGVNNGFSRSIKTFVSATSFTLITPLPFTPTAGDTFTIYPGCDKLKATCTGKFSNIANFRGTPDIPQPETAV